MIIEFFKGNTDRHSKTKIPNYKNILKYKTKHQNSILMWSYYLKGSFYLFENPGIVPLGICIMIPTQHNTILSLFRDNTCDFRFRFRSSNLKT